MPRARARARSRDAGASAYLNGTHALRAKQLRALYHDAAQKKTIVRFITNVLKGISVLLSIIIIQTTKASIIVASAQSASI